MERKNLAFSEFKMEDERGTFSGYLAAFGNVDHGGDIIEKGAFEDDLHQWRQKGELPGVLWFHDMSEPVGSFGEMYEDEKGLFVRAKLWIEDERQTEAVRKAYNTLTSNGPKGLSIGYAAVEKHKENRNGEAVRVLTKLKLYEGSIVPFPMNDQATITSAKGLVAGDTLLDIREAERFLRDAGLSRRQAKMVISHGYKAVCSESVEDDGGEKAAGAEVLSCLKSITQSME